MRWGRAVAIATVVVLAACGGGGNKSAAVASGSATDASGSNPNALAAGSSASAPEGAATGGASDGSSDTGGGPDAGVAPAANGDAPTPPGLKPFAGSYSYHTTGHATLNGSNQNIDVQSQTVIEDLNDSDQRLTSANDQGQQVEVLRYSGDKLEIVSLELKGAVSKTFNGPVLLAPVPTTVGQTWSWSMQSTDSDPTKRTTVTQSSRVDRTETIQIGGQSVDVFVVETDIALKSSPADLNATGHLTTWVSPAYKVSLRIHSTLKGTYAAFNFDGDTTSDLLSLQPS